MLQRTRPRTSFKIYFLMSAGELISDQTSTREMPAFGTETILLVDDDARVRELGLQTIEMGGYQLIAARSGEEAPETYAGGRDEIPLVVLDLIMRGMGGNDVLRSSCVWILMSESLLPVGIRRRESGKRKRVPEREDLSENRMMPRTF